ncbi:hypothetical protein ACHAXT_005945 [Thalassiosira profunda]
MDAQATGDCETSNGSEILTGGDNAPCKGEGALTNGPDDGKPPSTDDAAPPTITGQPNKKRKYHGTKSNGEDEHRNLDEATTVEDLSGMDVTTYLAWVNRQAQSLPDVFVAGDGEREDKESPNDSQHDDGAEPFEGSRATLQILLSKRMDLLPPPSARHLPKGTVTGESTSGSANTASSWVAATVSNFSALRTYLETEHAHLPSVRERKVAVPRMKDRAAWHVFCLGRAEAYGNAGGYYEEGDGEEEGDGANRQQAEREESKQPSHIAQSPSSGQQPQRAIYDAAQVPANGHPPTTSLLLQFDQVLTRTLFHHHVYYLCEWSFPLTESRAVWIYALLARMEKPWHREECSAVRRVLRECCERRWSLKLPDEGRDGSIGEESKAWEQLAHLNALIAITGIYYEQGSFAGGDGMESLFGVAADSA